MNKKFLDDEDATEQEAVYKLTTWVNDTQETARFQLMQVEAGKIQYSAKFRKIVIKPGQKLALESRFDDAIRTMERGRVVGGLCPWLKKEGEDEVEMEDCLDYKTVAETLEVLDLSLKLQKRKGLEEAIKIHSERKAQEPTVAKPKNKGGRPRVNPLPIPKEEEQIEG